MPCKGLEPKQETQSMTSDPNHERRARSIFLSGPLTDTSVTHLSRRKPKPVSRKISYKQGQDGGVRDVGGGVTHPLAVSHHGRHLITDQEFLCHVLHMLQGVRPGQRAALFDPGAGFPRGGEEMERATLLFI